MRQNLERVLHGQTPTKVCRHCGKELPVTEFSRNHRNKDGLDQRCKGCCSKRAAELRRVKANLPYPEPDYCECCGREGPLVVDHDRRTGKFRGYICRACNTSIGSIGDDNLVLAAQRLLNYHANTSD